MLVLLWKLRSYVPGTSEHSYYRRVNAHVRAVMKLGQQVFPGAPEFPFPIPRNLAACELALDSTEALLRSITAALSGGDPAAVFGEHMPTARRI